ncbi:MAG: MMPL family transporter [Gammaproteobacteria bacterium]|jgi:uncharacterized protein|nr:MMPL family transporter [Gammaproteobacteria bacterium]
MIIRYTEWLLRWKYAVVVATLLLVALLAAGLPRLHFTNDYRVFFSKENPQLLAFENLQNTYTKNDNVLFVITPKDGKVFTPETLTAVRDITKASWQIPYSIRVDSITNFQHTSADEDDLIVDDLVPDPETLSEEDLQYIKDVALTEPMLINRLISKDTAYTGVNVVVQLPGVDQMKETPEVVDFVRAMRTEMLQKHPNIEIRLVGMMMMNQAFPEASQRDGMTLVPLAFLAIILVTYILLRSISGTAATVLIVLFSIMAGMGVAGWLDIKLTPPSASAPIIILTVAIAGAIHLLVTVVQEMHKGMSKHDAIVESMRVNATPIFLTSLTTALGFLSMNASDAPPFRDLGNISAFGVVASYIFTISFLPAIMYVLPVKARHFVMGTEPMRHFGSWVVEKRKIILPVFALVSILLVMWVPKNQLNDVFVNYFDESVEFRVDTDYATKYLTGTYTIDYSLDSGATQQVSDPKFLQQVEDFANWYREQPEVLHVTSITDTFKRLNRNMHGDDLAWYKLPENNKLAAQYLLLYEMSLPYGLDLNNQIDLDKRSTRMSVILKTISSSQILALEERANTWLKQNTPNMVTDGASPAVMFSHIGMRNIQSMLTGTTIALVLISGVLIFSLRSFKYGIISLIPNILPAAIAFGIWAIFVGEIGLALSIVTAMTLGIVVDDTVHFISKYMRARHEKDLDSMDAVRYAFRHVGVAMWVTSAILIAGFMILSLSAFELNASMGLMTSMIIAIALALDFMMLPPLIMMFDHRTVEQAHKEEVHI